MFSRGKGGAKLYMNFFAEEKTCSRTSKITANHKEQTSQVNDFSAFLHMGRCKNLGGVEIFP